jgi:hypothetical protein
VPEGGEKNLNGSAESTGRRIQQRRRTKNQNESVLLRESFN